jgi:signal transduction histidine kinase
MTDGPALPVPRSLFHRVLAVNLGVTLVLYALLAGLSFALLNRSAERAARADIAAEMRTLAREGEELKVVAFVDEIDFRTAATGESRGRSLYLLLHEDGTRVAGNLDRWPDDLPLAAGRLRFDGSRAGTDSGSVLAEASQIHGGFMLLIGRRLEPMDVFTSQFLPLAALLLAGFSGLAAALTMNTARQYRRRIAQANEAFAALRLGDLKRRIAQQPVAGGDELAALSGNINLALADIERLVRGLDSFSQTAAHELNRELSHLREEARLAAAPRFVDAIDRMIGLLRELLALSRIEGRSDFDRRAVDLAAAVNAAASLYRDAGLPEGVELEVDVAATAGSRVHGIEEQIRGAFMNLIENALKHAPAGTTVRVAAHTSGNEVLVVVRDEGPGAPSEDLTELVAGGARGEAGGYGIGLRVVQAVAIRHGARLQLRNARPGLEVTLRFAALAVDEKHGSPA